MEPFCFLNGEIMPLSQAKVGLYDLGLLRGFGIYEGLISQNRKPFMFADHMVRFHMTAEKMQLEIPYADAQIEQAIHDLLEKNVPQGREGLIRIIQTGGPATDGIVHDPKTPTIYILVEIFEPVDPKVIETGCALGTTLHMRQFSSMKTTNYIQAVLLQKRKRDERLGEVLYVSGGRALECTGSNIFVIKDGKISTPGRDILFGITRKLAIDLAKREFQVEERDISVEELFAADEVFITGSFKEVVPVISIDGKQTGDGKPGPVSKRVIELFDEFAKSY